VAHHRFGGSSVFRWLFKEIVSCDSEVFFGHCWMDLELLPLPDRVFSFNFRFRVGIFIFRVNLGFHGASAALFIVLD
jgi:hypothetical protein